MLATAPPLNTTAEAAFRWQLLVKELDENHFGLESRDQAYGVEIIKLRGLTLPLGLRLVEEPAIGSTAELRSITLVEQTQPGGGVAARGGLRVGDTLTYVLGRARPDALEKEAPAMVERVEGLDLESTMRAIERVGRKCAEVELVVKRLVPRVLMELRVQQPDGSEAARLSCLAGANMRAELLKRSTLAR